MSRSLGMDCCTSLAVELLDLVEPFWSEIQEGVNPNAPDDEYLEDLLRVASIIRPKLTEEQNRRLDLIYTDASAVFRMLVRAGTPLSF